MALDDDIRLFTEIALFKQLDRDALRLLAFSAETRLFRAGDMLFQEGERSDGAFLLMRGAIELSADGREPLRLAPPALLGERALFAPTVRPARARALEPSTVLRIPRALFQRVLEEYPAGAARIHALMRERLEEIAGDLARFAGSG